MTWRADEAAAQLAPVDLSSYSGEEQALIRHWWPIMTAQWHAHSKHIWNAEARLACLECLVVAQRALMDGGPHDDDSG